MNIMFGWGKIGKRSPEYPNLGKSILTGKKGGGIGVRPNHGHYQTRGSFQSLAKTEEEKR
jgi:hypothetical protein